MVTMDKCKTKEGRKITDLPRMETQHSMLISYSIRAYIKAWLSQVSIMIEKQKKISKGVNKFNQKTRECGYHSMNGRDFNK